MPAWDGEEATEDDCGGYVGTDGEGLLGVWDTADGSVFVQVTEANVFVLQQQLDNGGTESLKGGRGGVEGWHIFWEVR